MTIELVDGHGGKPHISGDDLGDFKAGILGDAGYVFKRADMLAATLNGANSLTVNTGSGVLPVSGRHFRITAPETVTVTSGTQGQNRNDLVVIRPSTSTDGTTVENASVVVLRGTPTDGDAVDPEKEDTDLALYRLQLTGISVAEPIALFDVMVPYNEFRDSISHSRGTLLSGGCCYDRVGGLVVVHLLNCSTGTGGAQRTIGTLPQGYRPTKAIEGSSNIGAINKVFANQQSNFVRVYTDGRVVLDKFGSGSMDWTGQVVFPT